MASSFKNNPSIQKDSIIIIEPSYRLNAFALDAGLYKDSVLNSKKPIRLEKNGVELTRVASTGAVDDDTKWYTDGSFVYIKTFTAGDWVVVDFEMFFGSQGFKLPRDLDTSGSEEIIYCEPRISGIPTFGRNQKDQLAGISIAGDASFSLLNTNEETFTSLKTSIETYSFHEKNIRIYRYLILEKGQPIVLVFRGIIDNWNITRTKVTFSCRDFLKKMGSAVQTNEYDTGEYPDLDPLFQGIVQRTIYGQTLAICVGIDYAETPTQLNNRKWRVSLHANKSIEAVYLDDTLLTLTTHYTINGNNNEITLIDNLETALSIDTIDAGAIIKVDVKGKMDGSSNLIDNASDIVKDILKTVGFNDNDLDLPSFAQAKIDNTYEISMNLPKEINSARPTAKEVVELVNKSVLGYLTNDTEFKLKFNIFQTKASSLTLDIDIDLINRNIRYITSDMRSKIILKYNYDETKTKYLNTLTNTNETTLYLHKNKRSKTIETVLRVLADVQNLISDYSDYFGNPYIRESFGVKLQMIDNFLGDFITVDENDLELISLDESIDDAQVQARRV